MELRVGRLIEMVVDIGIPCGFFKRQEDHPTSHFRSLCRPCTLWCVSTRGDYSPLLLVTVFGALISCVTQYTHMRESSHESSHFLRNPDIFA